MEEIEFSYVEIKHKQWYRTGRNNINQILGSSGLYYDDYGIKKVANDPRELIEVDDFIGLYGGRILQVDEVLLDEKRIRFGDNTNIKFEDVIEIWTKTDNDTYKCQWRK